MDWNWFFSSLAQSAAAIAGLFGAFVVTKIITNDAQFRQKAARLVELLNRSENFRDRFAARYFRWYNKQSGRKDMNRLWRRLDKDKPNYKSPEEYYEQGGFSLYVPREKVIERIRESIRLHALPPRPRSFPELNIPPNFAFEQRLSDQIAEEGELISSLVLELRSHIRDVQSFAGDIDGDPESSSLITYAIAAVLAIFFLSVVYPLSFLPVSGTPQVDYSLSNFLGQIFSLRGLLLSFLALIFSAVMGVFWQANLRLKYPEDKVVDLRSWAVLGAYSHYLAVLSENELKQAEKESSTPPDIDAESNEVNEDE